MKKLLEYCTLSGNKVSKFEGEKNYVATGDIIDNQIKSTKIVNYNNKPSRANVVCEVDDVIFAAMKGAHKVLKIDFKNKENIYSTGFFSLKPNHELMADYLYYFLVSDYFNNQKDRYSTGATMKGINTKSLNKILINDIPNLDTQKERVNIIRTYEKAILNIKSSIIDLKKLIQSTYVKKFGYNSSEKWDIKLLNDVCLKITDGKHGGCVGQNNSGYYFVGATEIYDDKINYKNAFQIGKDEFEKDYKRCNLMSGDFVIVNTGATIGKSAIAEGDICKNILLQKSVALIRPNCDVLNPLFLKYCYECNPSMYTKGKGAARVNLLIQQIKNTPLIVPPIELQNEFEHYAKKIVKQIEQLEKNVADLEELKQIKLNEYFGENN